MRALTLMLAACAASCVRSPFPAPAPVENDPAVSFPAFHERPVVTVGDPGKHYTWEGELLQAVLIATNDFLPHRRRDTPCGDRLESQRYHVIREGSVIFVYLYEDEARCGGKYVSLDSGAKYAISADGRILRRVFDGQPETPLEAMDLDGGVLAKPGVDPEFERRDATAPDTQDAGPPSDGGT